MTGAFLPSLDGAPPVSDYTFSLYVSDDRLMSDDDIKLQYNISRVAGADLAKGIEMNGQRMVHEIVEGNYSRASGNLCTPIVDCKREETIPMNLTVRLQ